MNSNDILMLLFVLTVVVIAIVVSVYQTKKRGDLLRGQAEKRNGTVTKRSFLGRWELRLPFQDSSVLIYSVPGSRYSPPRTYAILKLDSPRLPTIEIMHNGLAQKLFNALGRERILTNDEEFDRQIVVRGEDQYSAQRLLTADLKQRIVDRSLRALDVKIIPQEVRVTIQAIPSNEEGYDNFIDLVFLILQKIL